MTSGLNKLDKVLHPVVVVEQNMFCIQCCGEKGFTPDVTGSTPSIKFNFCFITPQNKGLDNQDVWKLHCIHINGLTDKSLADVIRT